MRREQANKPPRDLTGLWRLEEDGVQLTLFNYQDMEKKLAVGTTAIHGSFDDTGSITLAPTRKPDIIFTVTGILNGGRITDAASGRVFVVKPDPSAESGKFATAEISGGPAGLKAGNLISHSGPVPRFFEQHESHTGQKIFLEQAVGHFWRLPPIRGVEKAALRFGQPAQAGGDGLSGPFEVSGPGLRFEGDYHLKHDKLTFTAPQSSLRNLHIIGGDALAQALLAEFSWSISPRGLELSGQRPMLLSGAL